MATEHKTFTVSFDQDDDGWMVHEKSNAFSFALIPVAHQYSFDRSEKAKAFDQVRRLHAWQRKGNIVETRMIDTPGRFEAVADTKYGCAW